MLDDELSNNLVFSLVSSMRMGDYSRSGNMYSIIFLQWNPTTLQDFYLSWENLNIEVMLS